MYSNVVTAIDKILRSYYVSTHMITNTKLLINQSTSCSGDSGILGLSTNGDRGVWCAAHQWIGGG